MKTPVYHVIGTTQYEGTCKMHLFKDCPQLTKKRIRQMNWGVSDSTGAIEETEWENLAERHTCKICLRRKAITPKAF